MAWISCGKDFLPDISTTRLKKAFAAEKNVKAKARLHSALLRRKGRKVEEIAEFFEKPKGTISKWLNRLQDEGLAGASPKKQPGRPRRLTPEKLKLLREDLLKLPKELGYSDGYWNTRLVKEHVRRKFRVSFTARHMTRLLSQVGFSYKKPRAFNPRRASDEEVAAFKKKRVERCWLPDAKAGRSSWKTSQHSR